MDGLTQQKLTIFSMESFKKNINTPAISRQRIGVGVGEGH